MPSKPPSITLAPISGPPLPAPDNKLVVPGTPNQPSILGRSTESTFQLPDATVSRQHAQIELVDSIWTLTDLGSRHGTFVNGNKLDADFSHPLNDRDQVRIGPWIFRVRGVNASSTVSSFVTYADDNPLATTRVQPVPAAELRSLAQQRLDVIIDCAARINSAEDFNELAGVALESVIAAAGFARAAMVRTKHDADEIELVEFRSVRDEPAESLKISRSLIEGARSGELVRLSADADDQQVNYGQSIVQLGIHSALCAPVMVGDQVQALMYLDARGAENTVRHDAAAFCQAISRLTGLALSNLHRQDLERRQIQLDMDLQAARQAQKLIVPKPRGVRGWHAYAIEMRPGRVVAGDLFDVVALSDDPEGPVACFLGDVTGKGVGAAITMATVQTHLRVALRHNADPASVVREVNRAVSNKMFDGKFISLWLGVMDPAAGECRFVDAGHGHWLVRPAGGPPELVQCVGGLPIGLDPDARYETETIPFEPGSRVLLFSDGLVEQPDPSGEMFGVQRAIDALAPTASAEEDVETLVRALREHAQTSELADDLTVASNEFLVREPAG
ncbi:MAG: SpoIIE family protein phosphatase [Phycisphaerales bacterium]